MEEIKGRTAKLISENDQQEAWQEIMSNIDWEGVEEDVLIPSSPLPVNDKPNMPEVLLPDFGEPDYVDTAIPPIRKGWIIIALIVFFILANN